MFPEKQAIKNPAAASPQSGSTDWGRVATNNRHEWCITQVWLTTNYKKPPRKLRSEPRDRGRVSRKVKAIAAPHASSNSGRMDDLQRYQLIVTSADAGTTWVAVIIEERGQHTFIRAAGPAR